MDSKITGFVVTTPVDTEGFLDLGEASDWAMCAVLGGYAGWAEVEDLASG
jgi:hypothetical protein